MTVITKILRDKYIEELNKRHKALLNSLVGTVNLANNKEGLKDPQDWTNVDALCKLDIIKLRLAVGDFNVLLTELSNINKKRRLR